MATFSFRLRVTNDSCHSLIVTTANKLGAIKLPPRGSSSLGIFSRYDGNIIGGSLLGAGMMLSGACPGTVLAQVGVGISSGIYALMGATLGGVAWTGYLKPVLSRSCPKPTAEEEAKQKLTVHETLGVSKSFVFLAFEAMCVAVIASAALFTTVGPEAKIPPVVGGSLIGLAQLLSLLLRRKLLGTSTSYEEVGGWFLGLLKGKGFPEKYSTMLLALGMISGARILASTVPKFAQFTNVTVSPLAAGLGGFLMIIGSRLAGGCTSGHGISGISLFSMSSFLTIGCAFATGGLIGLLQG